EQDAAAARGVRGPPAARRPGLPTAPVSGGGAPARQCPLACRRRGPASLSRQPAPAVPTLAQLQPTVEPHRAVLEETAAASDAQPPVRHLSRPEEIPPREPVVLPDYAAAGQDHARKTEPQDGQMRQDYRVCV